MPGSAALSTERGLLTPQETLFHPVNGTERDSPTTPDNPCKWTCFGARFVLVLFLCSFMNSCGCSTAKSKTPPHEIFFTHLTVQIMGPNHPWPLVIENWFHSFKKDAILRNVWLQKCRRSDGVNPNTARISRLHFSYLVKYGLFILVSLLIWNINPQ